MADTSRESVSRTTVTQFPVLYPRRPGSRFVPEPEPVLQPQQIISQPSIVQEPEVVIDERAERIEALKRAGYRIISVRPYSATETFVDVLPPGAYSGQEKTLSIVGSEITVKGGYFGPKEPIPINVARPDLQSKYRLGLTTGTIKPGIREGYGTQRLGEGSSSQSQRVQATTAQDVAATFEFRKIPIKDIRQPESSTNKFKEVIDKTVLERRERAQRLLKRVATSRPEPIRLGEIREGAYSLLDETIKNIERTKERITLGEGVPGSEQTKELAKRYPIAGPELRLQGTKELIEVLEYRNRLRSQLLTEEQIRREEQRIKEAGERLGKIKTEKEYREFQLGYKGLKFEPVKKDGQSYIEISSPRLIKEGKLRKEIIKQEPIIEEYSKREVPRQNTPYETLRVVPAYAFAVPLAELQVAKFVLKPIKTAKESIKPFLPEIKSIEPKLIFSKLVQDRKKVESKLLSETAKGEVKIPIIELARQRPVLLGTELVGAYGSFRTFGKGIQKVTTPKPIEIGMTQKQTYASKEGAIYSTRGEMLKTRPGRISKEPIGTFTGTGQRDFSPVKRLEILGRQYTKPGQVRPVRIELESGKYYKEYLTAEQFSEAYSFLNRPGYTFFSKSETFYKGKTVASAEFMKVKELPKDIVRSIKGTPSKMKVKIPGSYQKLPGGYVKTSGGYIEFPYGEKEIFSDKGFKIVRAKGTLPSEIRTERIPFVKTESLVLYGEPKGKFSIFSPDVTGGIMGQISKQTGKTRIKLKVEPAESTPYKFLGETGLKRRQLSYGRTTVKTFSEEMGRPVSTPESLGLVSRSTAEKIPSTPLLKMIGKKGQIRLSYQETSFKEPLTEVRRDTGTGIRQTQLQKSFLDSKPLAFAIPEETPRLRTSPLLSLIQRREGFPAQKPILLNRVSIVPRSLILNKTRFQELTRLEDQTRLKERIVPVERIDLKLRTQEIQKLQTIQKQQVIQKQQLLQRQQLLEKLQLAQKQSLSVPIRPTQQTPRFGVPLPGKLKPVKKSKIKQKGLDRKYKYAPTLSSIISGSTVGRTKGPFSGLEERPAKKISFKKYRKLLGIK